MRLWPLLVVVPIAAVGVACASILGVKDPSYGSADGGDGGNAEVACPSLPALPACEAGGLARCDPAGACDIDLANDTNNCGLCGHVCEGACTDGTCQPKSFGTMPGPARVLDADDANAYLTVANPTDQLFQVPLGGGGFAAGNALSGEVETIGGFVADPTVGFLLSGGGVDVTALDRTAAKPLLEGYTVTNVGRIVSDGASLVFTEGRSNGKVVGAAKDGTGATDLALEQAAPTFVLVAGNLVVFVNQSTVDQAIGAILYVDVTKPGTAHTKISNLTQVGGLVRVGDWAYYTLRKGEIWRLSLTDWTPIPVVQGLGEADTLAADDTYLYFTGSPANDGFGIYRVPRCGGDLTLVASPTGGHVTSLVAHGKYLYWVGQDQNELFRTTR